MVSALLHKQALSGTQHTILFAIRSASRACLCHNRRCCSCCPRVSCFKDCFVILWPIQLSLGPPVERVVGGCVGILFLSQYSIFGFSTTALLAFMGFSTYDGACPTSLGSYTWTHPYRHTLLLAGFSLSIMLRQLDLHLRALRHQLFKTGTRILSAWLPRGGRDSTLATALCYLLSISLSDACRIPAYAPS